ncbi:hypothetical protein [Streptomyces sp. or20]|uniref:hypothetical protein n=1 Tax=Streptomyces sp. or20 TaxID=1828016 RepID=UPI000BF20E36|nr:hypothetical protein [Streptomyces sp. or20]
MSESTAPEYLYEVLNGGPLGFRFRRYEIAKKTARRIYFCMGNGQGFVDRQLIETRGLTYHRPSNRYLSLKQPELATECGSPKNSPAVQAQGQTSPSKGDQVT